MRAGEQDPLRWRQSTRDPSALPARAADLVDAVREGPPLPAEALARIKVAVARAPARGAARAARRLAIRAARRRVPGVGGDGQGDHAAVALRRRARARPQRRAQHRLGARQAAASAAPAPRRSSRLDVRLRPVAAEVAAPPPRRAVARAARAAAQSGALAYDTTTEAQLLGRALSRLRQDHDARGALKLLDQYASTFPRGVLASEALQRAARGRHPARRSRGGAPRCSTTGARSRAASAPSSCSRAPSSARARAATPTRWWTSTGCWGRSQRRRDAGHSRPRALRPRRLPRAPRTRRPGARRPRGVPKALSRWPIRRRGRPAARGSRPSTALTVTFLRLPTPAVEMKTLASPRSRSPWLAALGGCGTHNVIGQVAERRPRRGDRGRRHAAGPDVQGRRHHRRPPARTASTTTATGSSIASTASATARPAATA